MKKIEEVYKALVRYGVGDFCKVADDNTLVCVDELTAGAVVRALRKDETLLEGWSVFDSYEDGKNIVKVIELDLLG